MTKFNLFAGLFALQGLFAATASAQTHLFKIGNADTKVRVADHIGGEELGPIIKEHTLEAYNLNYGGKDLIGLISFQSPSANIVFASHYWLPSSTDRVELLKGYERFIAGPNGADIIAQRVTNKNDVKSAILLHYDETGKITQSAQMPHLPAGYNFIRVLDVIECIDVQGPMRILCLLEQNQNPAIAELLYWPYSSNYTVRIYKMPKPPKSYISVHYVRAYHYGRSTIGNPSFYGLSEDGKTTSAFCYYEDLSGAKILERYELKSINGINGVSGVQMSGNYGPNGINRRIEMAFTDEEGGICIQQKDDLATTNWQRFYQLPDKGEFRLGWGRDGHATKQGAGVNPNIGFDKGYFLGAAMPYKEPGKAQVAALHYYGATGDLKQYRVYDIPGEGVFKDGGFPSTAYDVGGFTAPQYVHSYTFIADRQKEGNTFMRGTGNSMIDIPEKFFCSTPYEVFEASNKRLNTIKEEVDAFVSGPFNVTQVDLEPYEGIEVSVTLECSRQKEQALEKGVLPQLSSNSELNMTAERIRVLATDKAIASVQILSIDGRTILQQQQPGTSRYEHTFTSLLVPGIYIVRITYTDHSTEAKKISIY